MKLRKKEISLIMRIHNLGKFISVELFGEGYDNYNFKLTTTKGIFVIQIFNEALNKRKKEKIEPQFKILNHLKKKNFPYKIPSPIKNINRRYLTKFRKTSYWIYKFIEGEVYKKYNKEQLKEVAKAMAIYYTYVKDIKVDPKKIFDFDRYLREFEILKKKKAKNDVDRIFQENYSIYVDFLKKLKKIDFRKNVVYLYNDFNNTNLLFRGNKLIGIIDFNDLAIVPRVKEIAHGLRRVFFDGEEKLKRKIVLREYEKVSPLTKEEKKLIIWLQLLELCVLFLWAYGWLKKKKEEQKSLMQEILDETKNLIKTKDLKNLG